MVMHNVPFYQENIGKTDKNNDVNNQPIKSQLTKAISGISD
jgi:hypothetical protein